MFFILGVITGLLIASLIIATITYFKYPLIQVVTIAEKQVNIRGPRPKGFISLPVSEAEEARQLIIKKNREKGQVTRLSDLQND